MADVTPPISTLPGALHGAPTDSTCDDHPDRPTYRRVQGETDSFGSEMHDMCKECYDEYKAAVAVADTSGTCDWCKNHADKLSKRRDFDEGSCGPVYEVCDSCIKVQNDEAREERERYEDEMDWDE